MSDPQKHQSSNAPAGGFRSAWLVSGLVLWVLVIAAVFVTLRRGNQPLGESETGGGAAGPVTADGSPSVGANHSNVQATGPAEETSPREPPKPTAAWDAAGVKDFVFTERSGRKVTKADLLGHPWLVCFIFTRCAGPCPMVSTKMAELQKILTGTDVRLVTMTVDPEFDTTDVLKRYATSFNADSDRWLYLTGDKLKTYRLINESFRMPVMETTGPDRQPGFEVLHSTNIMLVNEKGVVVKKYNALNDVEMATLRRDLKPYLQQKISTPAEPDAPPLPVQMTPAKGNSQ